MKTITKVFLIISIVLSIIVAFFFAIITLVGFGTMLSPESSSVIINGEVITDTALIVEYGINIFIVGFTVLLFCIASLIISFLALKKINNALIARDISKGFKILVLIFSNIISGILLLCMGDNDYYPQLVPVYPTQQSNSDVDQIAKLKKLLDMGAITQEEFEYNKSKIIGANETAQENTL